MLEDAMACWNLPWPVGISHDSLEHSIEDLCTALAVLGMFLEHSRSQTLIGPSST
jgi:hypothetical protein